MEAKADLLRLAFSIVVPMAFFPEKANMKSCKNVLEQFARVSESTSKNQ